MAAGDEETTAQETTGQGLQGNNATGSSGGLAGTYSNNMTIDEGPSSPYSSYGYSGYGGGGGYGSLGKTPEQVQEETQAQITNTAGNYGRRGRDLDRLSKDNLGTIQRKIDQNKDLYKNTRRQNMRQIEWQPNQQREQSTLRALRDRMGNAAYGSATPDLMEGMARVDDMNDVALINAYIQNENAAYDNWFQAYEDLAADYADQANAIQDEFSKLYSQYWSTMSNVNPLLATEENIEKSTKGESSTVGEDTDAYTLPAIEGLTPSKELQELFKTPKRANPINPFTRNFVRPYQAVTQARKIANTGSRNRSTTANKGQLDNLNVYQRRV